MFVESMTSEELVAEFLKDYQHPERKFPYLAKEVRKRAIRNRNKFYKKMFDYKSTGKNKLLILVEHNNGTPLITPVVYYSWGRNMNAMTKHPDKNQFTHYTSHFFRRYNERFLKKEGLSTLDILKIFIPANSFETFKLIPQKNTDEYKVISRFRDGVGLGRFEETNKYSIEYLKTFISSVMIGDWQQLQYDILSIDLEKFWKEANDQSII